MSTPYDGVLLLSVKVNARASYTWPFHPQPEHFVYDPTHDRRLVGIEYRGSARPRRRDRVKHVWVVRMPAGGVRVAPGVVATWEPYHVRRR